MCTKYQKGSNSYFKLIKASLNISFSMTSIFMSTLFVISLSNLKNYPSVCFLYFYLLQCFLSVKKMLILNKEFYMKNETKLNSNKCASGSVLHLFYVGSMWGCGGSGVFLSKGCLHLCHLPCLFYSKGYDGLFL